MEENRALFRALRLEKLVTAIFIGLITFVAGLNVLVVLSMTVTDKARDVAVLMSMGSKQQQIRRIFLWQGIAIGATGTFAGLCVGYRSTGVCGAVCAVSSQRAGRSMDRSRRYGHFYRSNAIACARRSTAVAGGNPAL
jgi:cell division protein FtsX